MYLVFWFGKLITRSTSLSWISLQQNGKIQNYGNYNLYIETAGFPLSSRIGIRSLGPSR